MPTENEVKYIIDPNNRIFSDALFEKHGNFYFLEQSYISKKCRIRKCALVSEIRTFFQNPTPSFDDTKYCRYWFTFKQKVNGRLIEIEQEIDQLDYDDLKSQSTNNITKLRTNFSVGIVNWDIDFLFNLDHQTTPYFVIAEAEMPANYKTPPSECIPKFISDAIIYNAGKDVHFSNHSLSDFWYAKNLLSDLKKRS